VRREMQSAGGSGVQVFAVLRQDCQERGTPQRRHLQTERSARNNAEELLRLEPNTVGGSGRFCGHVLWTDCDVIGMF
jgi:hypothetical protein